MILYLGIPRASTNMHHHGELALLLATMLLQFAPHRDACALRLNAQTSRSPDAYAVPMLAMTAVLVIPYGLVAVARFALGGCDLIFSDELRYLLAQRSAQGQAEGWQFGLMLSQWDWLRWPLMAGFLVVTLAELLAPLVLVSQGFRYIWLAIMVPFHLITGLTMNIIFFENLLLYSVLLIELPQPKNARVLRMPRPVQHRKAA